MENLILVNRDLLAAGSVKAALRRHGFDLTVPAGSEAVLDAVVEGRPRALVYVLPADWAHDLALLRMVRRAAPRLPLILLAEEGSLELQRESLQLRPVYFAVFPVDEDELLGAVDAALNGPRVRPAAFTRAVRASGPHSSPPTLSAAPRKRAGRRP